MTSRRSIGTLALALFGSVLASGAIAQDYPVRPIRLIVSYPAGGPADVGARILADQLSKQLPQQIVVDNRPGAGGIVGTQAVATAEPDGYTLLLTGNNVSIAQLIANTPPKFDAAASFEQLGRFAVITSGLFVSAASEYRTFDDLRAALGRRGGELTFGTGGVGSPSHLGMELLKRRGGFDIRHVPYRGTPPAITDLIGGRIDMVFTSLAGSLEQVQGGSLRLLAVSSPGRLPQLPDVPALAEFYPGYEFETWLGLAAPRGLPAAAAARLGNEVERALGDAALAKRLGDAGLAPSFERGDATTARVRAELEAYARIIRDANIKAE